MGQVSRFLRRVQGGYAHWCPGCGEVHTIFDNWGFNGNVEIPTFTPSVKVTGKRKEYDADGKWTGWTRDANGNAIDHCCHYFLTNGQLQFCGDSMHELAGKTVPLPELPLHM